MAPIRSDEKTRDRRCSPAIPVMRPSAADNQPPHAQMSESLGAFSQSAGARRRDLHSLSRSREAWWSGEQHSGPVPQPNMQGHWAARLVLSRWIVCVVSTALLRWRSLRKTTWSMQLSWTEQLRRVQLESVCVASRSVRGELWRQMRLSDLAPSVWWHSETTTWLRTKWGETKWLRFAMAHQSESRWHAAIWAVAFQERSSILTRKPPLRCAISSATSRELAISSCSMITNQ